MLNPVTLLHASVVIAPSQTSLLHASGGGAFDPSGSLLQYGPLGIIVLAFFMGWIVPGPQAKQLLEENKRLTGLIEGKLLPMSEQYAATLERSAIALEKSTSVLEQIMASQHASGSGSFSGHGQT